MKKFVPIIRIIGLPGAGKSTLANKLAKDLKLPVYGIGEYRSKFPMSPIGEADAWVALYRDLSRRKWRNCILETTGLNSRESFLKTALPLLQTVTIKLEAQRKILYERINKKKKGKQGGEWLFSPDYADKYEFVKKLFKEFKKIPAEIRIDTSKLKAHDVYKIALRKLKNDNWLCNIQKWKK
ncbi:MAG: Cytidylate kinase [Candidatus Scalindua rubra]|uniref:Cytidylate kinase n=1 Tax=Candidatus Scalindua rubra TaxID=1872076 RepID=A0A1E3X7A9_9BACT|nr:MAG: Cytidylate kinase [Candidatus Scalindua rubra]